MQIGLRVPPHPACSALIYPWSHAYICVISAAFPEGLFVYLNFSKSGDKGGERRQSQEAGGWVLVIRLPGVRPGEQITEQVVNGRPRLQPGLHGAQQIS